MTKAPLVPSEPGQQGGVSPGSVATAVVLGLLTLMTLAGNLLVFLAVASDKKLRNVSNLFIVSLSLADLLVGTVVMVPAALSEVCQQWVLGTSFCPVWASFDVMLCSASVLNVCLISFDRYLSIMTPLRYNALMTARRAALLLVIAWSIAVASSFVPISNGWHNPDHNTLTNLTAHGPVPQCVLRVSLPYALTASFVTIFLPIIIAFVLYCRVSSEAKRQALFVRSLIAPSRVLLGQELTTSSIREPFTRKATVTLGVIVGAYVVTWTPFLVTNVIDAHCKCVPAKVFGAFVWLGYCNSLVNPIIYPLLMRDFRKVYMAQLRVCCPGLALAFLRKSPKHTDNGKQTPVGSTREHSVVLDRTQHLTHCNKMVNQCGKMENHCDKMENHYDKLDNHCEKMENHCDKMDSQCDVMEKNSFLEHAEKQNGIDKSEFIGEK
ncbi:hypothetical protein BaRGS_00017834 [Batillaria attramentaria]|uniref:G-protein coupled receptors family 1 profile domain-containing protein n=1 Tax=Batillaria attramentaria TaxID=370345 RepID=A0ABD0KW25_9CAEN